MKCYFISDTSLVSNKQMIWTLSFGVLEQAGVINMQTQVGAHKHVGTQTPIHRSCFLLHGGRICHVTAAILRGTRGLSRFVSSPNSWLLPAILVIL